MTKKPPPPKLPRASKRAYDAAIKDAGERTALKRHDPKAIERNARRRAFANIDHRAATMPTAQQAKAVTLMKRGVHRT